MKVKVETKITVLEGEEKGREFAQEMVTDTVPQYTEYGVIEHLILKWSYIHNEPPIMDIDT